MAPYKIIKQGYMLKEPPSSKRGLRKKLRRYWFVLLEDKKQVAFVYYKNEESYIARQRNVGFIRIDNSRVNVIGEYLTYKNAFSIITERSSYMFVPETRYELHDWIYTLHNTLEGFHRRIERVKVRLEQRQRALSASSAASGSAHSNPATPITSHPPLAQVTTSTGHSTSPQTTPNQTTPNQTPPNASPRMGSGRRHRPRRPAPVAPGKRMERETASQPTLTHYNSPKPNEPSHTQDHSPRPNEFRQYSHEGPAFTAVTSSSTTTQELDLDMVLDLEIAQIEEALQEEEGEGEDDTLGYLHELQSETNPQPRGEGQPAPVHQRSESDTMLLSRTNSASLPELVEHDNSASPVDIEEAKRQISEESPVVQFRTKHTRHLSLLDGKRKKRRPTSLKNRSRSPPNYPPPPPPTKESGGNDDADSVEDGRDSVGFSKVLKTISSISHELEEMGGMGETPSISPPMRFRAVDPHQSSSQESPDGGEWPQEIPQSTSPLNTVSLEGGEEVDGNMENPSPIHIAETTTTHTETAAKEERESTEEPLSPSKRTPPPVAAKPKAKLTKPKKNKVMFKEEVEDIPSYEPRIDNEEAAPQGDVDEDIPSSVAELKKMLFGEGGQPQKYSKEGPMSLRYGAIVDTDGYDENLHELLSPTKRQSSLSPERQQQSNTSTAEERDSSPQTGVASPTLQNGEKDVHENEYDSPWDRKPVSKYSVVGHRSQSLSPAQKAQQFKVVSHTTAVPGNMERRNVNSLERQLRKSPESSTPAAQEQPNTSPSPAVPRRSPLVPPVQFSLTQNYDSDLLQSISNTLQSRSKYGSDSFLSMGQTHSFSQGDVPINYNPPGQSNQQGRSARSDLERIRTQHRRLEGTKMGSLPGHAHPGYRDSKLQQKRVLSRSFQSVNKGAGGRGRGKGFGQQKKTQKTKSMDGLQASRSTLVSYDTYTRSHTYQSLV